MCNTVTFNRSPLTWNTIVRINNLVKNSKKKIVIRHSTRIRLCVNRTEWVIWSISWFCNQYVISLNLYRSKCWINNYYVLCWWLRRLNFMYEVRTYVIIWHFTNWTITKLVFNIYTIFRLSIWRKKKCDSCNNLPARDK